jgi:secreted trypsin-like serine protease
MRAVVFCLSLLVTTPVQAMVGGARETSGDEARSIVMLLGSGGRYCTATAIARDLLLTAAHCVPTGSEYRLLQYEDGKPALKPVARIARHPSFNANFTGQDRATADLALVKLADPLPGSVRIARLAPRRDRVQAGETFRVVGYGLSVPGDGKTGGRARLADLVAVGTPSTFQIRLADPATRGTAAGLGACTGDSGGPAFQSGGVVGVISWSTGPNASAGCGGLTGIAPLTSHYGWIVETARAMGSPVGP